MRYRLLLAYIGTGYHGWQVQAEPIPTTIQGILERVLAHLVQEPVRVIGSGRTDAGVHAKGQVAHCTLPDSARIPDLRKSTNALLPQDIRVLMAKPCADTFHARFDAVAKTYCYHFWTEKTFLPPHKSPFVWNCGPLNTEAMQETLSFFLGSHNFSSFQNTGTDVRSCVRTLFKADISPLPNEPYYPAYHPELVLTVTADGFLKQMVRNIAGLLAAVGRSELTPKEATIILSACDRTKNPCRTAPAKGLFLANVAYKDTEKTLSC
ncbi:MAG: tRNA pseudouridine(38-40) synthase TruA [Desulfovibrio sp.]|nr:tRNA pseudouridine(38-40) synthase TruA [Desulfovibrio sp.]